MALAATLHTTVIEPLRRQDCEHTLPKPRHFAQLNNMTPDSRASGPQLEGRMRSNWVSCIFLAARHNASGSRVNQINRRARKESKESKTLWILSESFRPNLTASQIYSTPHSDLTTGGTLFSLRLQSVGVWFEPMPSDETFTPY